MQIYNNIFIFARVLGENHCLLACWEEDCWGIPPNPNRRQSLSMPPSTPSPFFIRRGLKPLSKPLAILARGFNLFRGKTLYIKDLVWLAKPVPYRASHILLNGALPHIYLIPCLNTEGFRGEQPLRDIIIPPHGVCGGIINERDMKPMLSKFYFLLLSIQFSILKPGFNGS